MGNQRIIECEEFVTWLLGLFGEEPWDDDATRPIIVAPLWSGWNGIYTPGMNCIVNGTPALAMMTICLGGRWMSAVCGRRCVHGSVGHSMNRADARRFHEAEVWLNRFIPDDYIDLCRRFPRAEKMC